MMDTDPDPANIMPQVILIAILTLLNAFFASAEMAIVSINKNRIKALAEDGDKKAILLEALIKEPTRFLSTIQVGITLAGFFSAGTATKGISGEVGKLISKINIPYSDQISWVLVTVALAYFTLVLGELYPKRIALQKAEKTAMFAVKPILFILKITSPFVKLLSWSTNLMLKITGINPNGIEEKVSKEEIQFLVGTGQEHGVINEIEREMIDSVIEFDDKIAEEVMTPRTDVYMINVERPLSEYIDELIEEKYSRIPVFKDDSDNIIGILYMKDFIVEARKVGFENVDIQNILRDAYFVPERKNVNELFKELQANRCHMAILIDEYGGFSGIVTIEDLIEEIMGDISDEYDDDEAEIKVIDQNTFIVSGLMSIQDLNNELDLEIEENTEDYDTLGGFIISILGHIPGDDEKTVLEYNDLTLKIELVKDKRIEKVKICKHASTGAQI